MKKLKIAKWLAAIILTLFVNNSSFGATPPLITSDTLESTYDVVVVGAGCSGVTAAIQAARLGAKVALLEETDWIGGQMTAAAVTGMDEGGLMLRINQVGASPDWVKAVRERGIYQEFINRIKDYYQNRGKYRLKSISTALWAGGPAPWDSIAFEPNIGQQILKEMIQETRLKFLSNGKHPILHVSLQTVPKSALMSIDGKTVMGLVVEITTPGGVITKTITSKIVIDATECGDFIPLTPARYRVGNYITSKKLNLKENVYMQDITYVAVIKKYPLAIPAEIDMVNSIPPEKNNSYAPIEYSGFPGSDTYLFQSKRFPFIVTNNDEVWNGKYPVSWAAHNAYRGMPDSDNPESYIACNVKTEMEKISKSGVNWANDYPSVSSYSLNDRVLTTKPNPRLSVRYLEDLAYRKKVNGEAKLKTLQFLYYVQKGLNRPWSVDKTSGFDTPYHLAHLSSDIIPSNFNNLEKYFPLIPYVRESRRLVGMVINKKASLILPALDLNDGQTYTKQTLTGFDIKRKSFGYTDKINGLDVTWTVTKATINFPTAVAVGDYGMDLHNASWTIDFESFYDLASNLKKSESQITDSEKGVDGPFQVPFECFVPETVDGLLVAEKNISVSRLAAGAIRLQPISMLTGQAAGAIAAISVAKNMQPRDIDPLLVQIELLKAGSNLLLTEYPDVPKSNPFWPYVQLVTLQGIFVGTPDRTFGIDSPITRAAAAVTFCKTFNITLNPPPTPQTPQTFVDVPTAHWAFRFIDASYKMFDPVSSGYFYPDAPITRQEYAKMIINALKIDPFTADSKQIFYDVPSNNPYFSYIQIMKQINLTAGCGSGNFCPTSIVSRGQAAVFLAGCLLLKANNNNYMVPPGKPVVTDEGLSTSKTNQLYAGWSLTAGANITEYQYSITQDSPVGTFVRGWTSTGRYSYVTAGGFSLTIGKKYYFSVRAKNNTGLWGPIGYSDGITVAASGN